MADVATAPAAEASQGKQQIVKPEKPDEDKYKEDLAKAEKEHTAAQEKLVGLTLSIIFRPPDTTTVGNLRHQCNRGIVTFANIARMPAKLSSTSLAQITRTRRMESASKSLKPS
jgi:hypothetical protein|tara:strand:- start:1202 stop:1543 length:342 start_codon:yes stop_codon:yes gene_type:complete